MMDRVEVRIEGGGDARASEILADLRMVAETLYFPLRQVGFWDYGADLHLCPHEERREACPHGGQGADGTGQSGYAETMRRERRARLEVEFPHARVSVYLA